MLENIKKKVLISIILAGVLYLGFTLYANYGQVGRALEKFNWLLFPLLLLLSFMNYVTRFFKWDYYLSIINVKIKKLTSFSIFMSGLLMAVTPGKVGEFLKCYLVKEITETPMSKTGPIVIAERITDSVSIILIILIGAYFYNVLTGFVLFFTILLFLIIYLLSNKRISLKVISFFENFKFLEKHMHKIHTAYESSYILLRPLPLFKMILLSLFAWFFECLSYYIILKNFNVNVDLFWASFSYGLSTMIGAVSMIPGGLGFTEGSMTFLLVQKHYSKNIAVASTILIRIVTLWFAVLIGIVSLSIYQSKHSKLLTTKI
jgi:uncharacterized protein (TIRG00374 family)